MHWLKIERDGRPQVDESTRERLAGRCYTLVPTPPDLVVGVPWSSDPGAAESVILAGDLARVSFPDLITLIAHNDTTGVLRVISASATRTVIFSEGEVRGASSDRVGERLGEIAVRMSLIKEADLDGLRDEPNVGRRAGRVAVERGLLSERDLWNAIQEHVITIFQAILLEAQGSFLLTQEPIGGALTVPGLGAAGLLMEGVRRMDELRMRGGDAQGGGPARVLMAFNRAFRDICITADRLGAGDALRAAMSTVFEEDPSIAPIFRDVAFSDLGELPEAELLPRVAEVAESRGVPAEGLLSDALSTAVLFLLFVSGEHLETDDHRALHTRVKAIISPS